MVKAFIILDFRQRQFKLDVMDIRRLCVVYKRKTPRIPDSWTDSNESLIDRLNPSHKCPE